MLRKRIIFTLIYSNGYFHQSRNFRLQRVGNLNWLEKNYKFAEIAFALDELIVINANRNGESFTAFAKTVSELVYDVFIPVCAGGGIRSVSDADLLFNNGADKIILNSSLYDDPSLVKQLVKKYGSQSVVASIDYKRVGKSIVVCKDNGSSPISMALDECIEYVHSLEVGELYLNSIDKDGTGFGYDLDIINEVSVNVKKPLIIAGGAGNEFHLIEGLEILNVNAVATANLFNFIGNGLSNARAEIIKRNINIAIWK